ncbi:Aspartyl/glutamyl-tRNA(Asn/Gln) amidotransferase subunit [Dirofilaria immitis]
MRTAAVRNFFLSSEYDYAKLWTEKRYNTLSKQSRENKHPFRINKSFNYPWLYEIPTAPELFEEAMYIS